MNRTRSDSAVARDTMTPTAASPPLWRNVSWALLGNSYFAMCRWLTLIAIAKFTSVENVGQFAFATAVTTPIFLCTNLQLAAIQTVDTGGECRYSDFLRLRMMTLAIGVAITVMVSFVGEMPPTLAGVLLLMAAAKCCEGFSEITYGLLQNKERFGQIAVSLFLRGTTGVLFSAGLLMYTGSLVWAVFGLSLAWGLSLFANDMRAARRVLAGLEKGAKMGRRVTRDEQAICCTQGRLVVLLKSALPMGIVTLLMSLSLYAPFYFVKSHLGDAPLGVFAAMICFYGIVVMLVTPLGRAAAPRMARYYAARKRRAFLKVLSGLVLSAAMIGLAALVAASVLGQTVLRLLFSAEYATHYDVLVLVMLSALLAGICSPLGYALTSARKFRIQVPMLLLTVIVTCLACAWLVPVYGISGAAFAMLAREATLLSLCVLIIARMFLSLPATGEPRLKTRPLFPRVLEKTRGDLSSELPIRPLLSNSSGGLPDQARVAARLFHPQTVRKSICRECWPNE